MIKKILSLLTAAAWIIAWRSNDTSKDERWWIPFVIVLFPLAAIWFSEFFASFSTTRVGAWRQPTSPAAIAFFGWLGLLIPPILAVMMYVATRW